MKTDVGRLTLPPGVRYRSLTTLREHLIKIGAKIVHHTRSETLQMAEVAIPDATTHTCGNSQTLTGRTLIV